ncbi:MAG: glycosyltransferase [Alphaproteobacteria bacterium]|nr:glycosyltransferase [Alphaproteobacteria bacterium]
MTPQHVAGALAPPARDYDVDIIILSLDRPDETMAAVRSALAQRGISRHIVVVDQGSEPANLARLASLLRGRLDATLVRLPENLGVAGGRNRASAIGHGRVIVALDNDAEFATDTTAAEAAAALDEDAGLGALGFRILAHANGEDDQSSWGYPPRLKPLAAGSFDAATFVGAGHAIRRTTWEQAGGYDEALFFCWEEFDFCLRAIALGWTIRYRGDLAVLHKVSPGRRVAWSATRWFYFVRNRLYIERKYGASWLSLTPRVAGYFLRGLRNGVPGQMLRGVAAAVGMSRTVRGRALPLRARAYLARTDRAHRGTLLGRLRDEVMAALPAPAPDVQTRRVSLSRNSSLKIGGSSTR